MQAMPTSRSESANLADRAASPHRSSSPRRSPSPAAAGQDSRGPFLDALSEASDLLNADRPRQALQILEPFSNEAAAKAHYGFQGRLGNAYMGTVDELVAANRLGAFMVTPDASGSWSQPTIHAERLSCYLGVLGAYGRMLEILQHANERAQFVEKNGEDVLHKVEDGVRAGISHAMFECHLFLNRIFQVNSNKASRDFVESALRSGTLSENDSVVKGFRQAASDSLYEVIADATQAVFEASKSHPEAPQLFWLEWLQKEKESLLKRPEINLAARFADIPGELGQNR